MHKFFNIIKSFFIVKQFHCYYCLFLLLFINSVFTSSSFAFSLSGDTIQPLPKINKTFAVVVHVVQEKNGDLLVDTSSLHIQISSMNEAFAPIGVSFKLVKIFTIPNYRYDVPFSTFRNEMLDQFLVKDRINIFYVDSILDPKASGLGSLGGIASPENVAIWVQKETNPLVHEMGHYWGLMHTFEGSGIENVDGSNCTTAGDLVCDTPADPYIDKPVPESLKKYIDSNCVFIGTMKDAKNRYYMPNTSNIMSYYDCPCATFTRGQYLRMVNIYQTNPTKW